MEVPQVDGEHKSIAYVMQINNLDTSESSMGVCSNGKLAKFLPSMYMLTIVMQV